VSPLSILVIDDNVQFGRVLSRICASMGHTVTQAAEPWEIFALYGQQRPDIIFLDIFMPEFNGVDVARWLGDKHFDGKLVFMTGYHPNFLGAARRSVERQIDAEVTTLEKPARVEQILRILSGTQSIH
jgi:CheY-like chemotaxis protein